MPKKEDRQIRLDPMEWKDAMRKVVPKAGDAKKPAKQPGKKKT